MGKHKVPRSFSCYRHEMSEKFWQYLNTFRHRQSSDDKNPRKNSGESGPPFPGSVLALVPPVRPPSAWSKTWTRFGRLSHAAAAADGRAVNPSPVLLGVEDVFVRFLWQLWHVPSDCVRSQVG